MDRYQGFLKGLFRDFQRKRWTPRQHDCLETILLLWNQIVSLYNLKKLTHQEDKLVALSGIVKRVQKLVELEYIAGTWKECLIYFLHWKVKKHDPDGQSHTYVAPSWPWPSANGEIEFDVECPIKLPKLNLKANILAADISLVNESLPFGQLSGGAFAYRL